MLSTACDVAGFFAIQAYQRLRRVPVGDGVTSPARLCARAKLSSRTFDLIADARGGARSL